MKISDAGVTFIRQQEGCVLHAYPDPGTGGEPWTIGVGHTGGVVPGMTITQAEADALLREDFGRFEAAVNRLVTVPLSQAQFDALVSFSFNVGEGALTTSTLLRKLNAGDYAGAGAEFLRWNRGGSGVMEGLTKRREAERAMFDGSPAPPQAPQSPPQGHTPDLGPQAIAAIKAFQAAHGLVVDGIVGPITRKALGIG